jgi:hypothetical protein
MKKIVVILLAGASLVGAAGIASGQYYYGGGNYYGRPGPYYGDPYRGRYYHDGYYQRGRGAIVGRDSFGRQELYYPVGRGGRCPPGYTVQDGVCKRYRGY